MSMAGESVTLNIAQEHMSFSPPRYDNITEMAKEGENRLCPLCQSPIRLFYINFNDKFLMCENTQCEFPFGHEELKIVKPGDELSDDETSSIKSSRRSKNYTASVSSGKTWSDIDRLNKALERSASVEDIESEKSYCSSRQLKRKIDPKEDEKIMKSIEDIKEMHEELNTLNQELLQNHCEEGVSQIRNEKWIKNLKSLQEMSGVQLLRPEEMGLLKKEPAIGLGELKIDIGPGSVSSVSSITIQIHNTSKDSDKSVVDPATTPDKPV